MSWGQLITMEEADNYDIGYVIQYLELFYFKREIRKHVI